MDFRVTRYGLCSPGFKAGGIRRGKYGVALVVADGVCETAACFTKNSVQAAPVAYTKKMVGNGVQAIVINSGNANCCVPQSLDDTKSMVEKASSTLGVELKHVAVASTGIIGRRMDVRLVKELIAEAAAKLTSNAKGSIQAAKAIMTTDTRIKMYSAEYNGIRVGGICKGAGMIAPNMATMLCFITTNAKIPKKQLKKTLKDVVDETFNMITVEGDMSTNDTVMVLSSMAQKCKQSDYKALLSHVTGELARMIVKDGEGATKFIEVEVKGAKTTHQARRCVKTILNSPLVKTAFYGENPNWGRILSACGATTKIEWMNTDIMFSSGNHKVNVLSKGKSVKLEKASKIMKCKDIKVTVDLHMGKCTATGYGCDLTPEYVKINAGYN